jgi:hypothetical protein
MSIPSAVTADLPGLDPLSVLADAGPPLALVDAQDRIVWCSTRFAEQLTDGSPAALLTQVLPTLLDDTGAAGGGPGR